MGVAQAPAALVGGAAGDLLEVAQLDALVGELGQERRHPQRAGDLAFAHGVVEVGQVEGDLALRQLRHDRAELLRTQAAADVFRGGSCGCGWLVACSWGVATRRVSQPAQWGGGQAQEHPDLDAVGVLDAVERGQPGDAGAVALRDLGKRVPSYHPVRGTFHDRFS